MKRDRERELEADDRRGRIFSFDVTKLGRWVAAFFSKRKPYKPRTFEPPTPERRSQ